MSTTREDVYQSLLRSITLSAGEFALLFARCNSIELQNQIILDLSEGLNTGLFRIEVQPSDRAINLVDLLETIPPNHGVACVTGLERSPVLNDILAIANNVREDYRKRLSFPVVFWVTDDVETRLRRQSPDFASWAGPTIVFTLKQSELQEILERETATVVDYALRHSGAYELGSNLKEIWQEWQRSRELLNPELEARIALAFGLDAETDIGERESFERCLSLQNLGELGTAANYRLGLWWERQGKLNRAEFMDNCDRAKGYLQSAWDEQKGTSDEVGVALGRVLLTLALPDSKNSKRWQAVETFATQLDSKSALAHGLWAEVALVKEDFKTGKAEASRAIELSVEPEGVYLLAMGRSLLGLEKTQKAIAILEEAKMVVASEVDPDLHIRILKALHSAYWADEDYQQAFAVKCDRAAVETEFGFRAFIGAGRLRPRRRLGAIGEAATEESAASGRQADIDALVARVKRNDCRLTVIHGPSGVGKSSLIRAGLVPTLRQTLHQSRRVMPVVVEQYENWEAELAKQLEKGAGGFQMLGKGTLNPPILVGFDAQKSTGLEDSRTQPPPKWGGGGANIERIESSPTPATLIQKLKENDRRNLITVLIFDQFEEFFFNHHDVSGRRPLYDFLRDCLDVGYVWVFLSLREDYIHHLLQIDRLANLTLITNDILKKDVRYPLGNFTVEEAKHVIRELTETSPYRLEKKLIDRLANDLAADLGKVRPIEMQVVGAEMLHSEDKITMLEQYDDLEKPPKKLLVERWLTQVVKDCGNENEELARRTLVALTEEPEKRPVKSLLELSREVRLSSIEIPSEEENFEEAGDLEFVIQTLIGSGLAFEIPATQEVGYQLIHDYLVLPIRQQFGGELAKELTMERQKRQVAEKRVEKLKAQVKSLNNLIKDLTEEDLNYVEKPLGLSLSRDALEEQKRFKEDTFNTIQQLKPLVQQLDVGFNRPVPVPFDRPVILKRRWSLGEIVRNAIFALLFFIFGSVLTMVGNNTKLQVIRYECGRKFRITIFNEVILDQFRDCNG